MEKTVEELIAYAQQDEGSAKELITEENKRLSELWYNTRWGDAKKGPLGQEIQDFVEYCIGAKPQAEEKNLSELAHTCNQTAESWFQVFPMWKSLLK
jgi:hypothetical protein